jgi:ferrous iron transport protein A
MSPLATLDRVAIGERVRVVAVTGPVPIRRRLMEMGLCNGVVVDVLRRAPLGDPLEVRLRGYLLSLRGVQAALIRVERLAAALPTPHAA